MRNRRRGQAGVTLIEMLVVVTIIALFVAIVAPNMMHRADIAKQTAARLRV
jgi:general secretion pathway protein G